MQHAESCDVLDPNPHLHSVTVTDGGMSGVATYRGDIDGLRAIAVGLVVLFHADVSRFAGGYVGVDAFFVLSGFLITGLLLRELHACGAISLRDFYARRARRLLPLALLVIISTLIATRLFLAPIDFESVG